MRKYRLSLIIALSLLLTACTAPYQPSGQEQKVASIPPGYFYFYSTGCTHCATVNSYVQQNNIKQRIFYVEKEVSGSSANADLLRIVGSRCAISEDELSVPLFWDGKNCYEGADNVISYLRSTASN